MLTEGVRAVVILWGLVVVFCRSWAVVSKGVRADVFFERLSLKSG